MKVNHKSSDVVYNKDHVILIARVQCMTLRSHCLLTNRSSEVRLGAPLHDGDRADE